MTKGRGEGQPSLAGRKVLVVEDEYLIADDLADMLTQAGANVVGPAASLPIAMRMLDQGEEVDAAVLDINLRDVEVFPLADRLHEQRVPMIFLTGYGENAVPDRFSSIGRCEKPLEIHKVIEFLGSVLGRSGATA